MKNKFILTTIALIISAMVYSQKKELSGVIIDSTTKKNIDYVYILDSLNKVISVTDEFGNFNFNTAFLKKLFL